MPTAPCSSSALRAAARSAGLRGRLKCVHLGEPESTDFTVDAHGDARGFAELALRQLLKFGFEDYAFAPDPRNLPWSRARGEAFTSLVALAGKRIAGLAAVPSQNEGKALTERYLPWLAALPRPCGVFAANDIVGEAVTFMDAFGLPIPPRRTAPKRFLLSLSDAPVYFTGGHLAVTPSTP